MPQPAQESGRLPSVPRSLTTDVQGSRKRCGPLRVVVFRTEYTEFVFRPFRVPGCVRVHVHVIKYDDARPTNIPTCMLQGKALYDLSLVIEISMHDTRVLPLLSPRKDRRGWPHRVLLNESQRERRIGTV